MIEHRSISSTFSRKKTWFKVFFLFVLLLDSAFIFSRIWTQWFCHQLIISDNFYSCDLISCIWSIFFLKTIVSIYYQKWWNISKYLKCSEFFLWADLIYTYNFLLCWFSWVSESSDCSTLRISERSWSSDISESSFSAEKTRNSCWTHTYISCQISVLHLLDEKTWWETHDNHSHSSLLIVEIES